MSKITDFFAQTAPNTDGRMLYHIMGLPNHQLEASHDLIQWMFPTKEKSKYNPTAPVLSEEDIEAFNADDGLRAALRGCYNRFLTFLGLAQNDNGKVVKGENFKSRYDEVWGYWNHNFLRITRAIASLRTLGLMQESWALYEGCVEIARNEGVPITEHTFAYWKSAVSGKQFPDYGGGGWLTITDNDGVLS